MKDNSMLKSYLLHSVTKIDIIMENCIESLDEIDTDKADEIITGMEQLRMVLVKCNEIVNPKFIEVKKK